MLCSATMKSTLSCVASRSTALIVSPGLVRSSYSMISTLRRDPVLHPQAAALVDLMRPGQMLGQWVIAAPAAGGPVFGAAPITDQLLHADAVSIGETLASAAAAARKMDLRLDASPSSRVARCGKCRAGCRGPIWGTCGPCRCRGSSSRTVAGKVITAGGRGNRSPGYAGCSSCPRTAS